jgi:hypothetical protein
LSFRQDPTERVVAKAEELAKQLISTTNYQLIPVQILFSEKFPHSIETQEGKRTLISHLTPLLAEVEQQIKKDTFSCEKFTRCISTRNPRTGCYEYTDVDTLKKVLYEDFEKR